MRAWWAAKPTPLSEDFEAFGDDIIRNRHVDPAVVARWRHFVSGEGLPASAHHPELQ
jgi:hypothetical protein